MKPCSDGLTEAMNPENQQYEESGLIQHFETLVTENISSEEMLGSILIDVDLFCEGEKRRDDITIVVVKIR